MNESTLANIKKSRFLLRNPYAYLSGDTSYDAIEVKTIEPNSAQISDDRRSLDDPYAHLNPKGGYDAIFTSEIGGKPIFRLSKKQLELIRPYRSNRYVSDMDIENAAITLHRILWKELGHTLSNPIKMLDPSISFRALGYKYSQVETLRLFTTKDETFEVAGTINNQSRTVEISKQFSLPIQNFTSAHELGHALLHESLTQTLHRDRPQDKSSTTNKKDSIEYQADKFAVHFLMPEKLLRNRFRTYFLTDYFTLNEGTIFALVSTRRKDIEHIKSLRDLSRFIAKAESYNGDNFHSLSSQFGVSVEAMAIRIEELGLCAI